jgi:hypothetical protein
MYAHTCSAVGKNGACFFISRSTLHHHSVCPPTTLQAPWWAVDGTECVRCFVRLCTELMCSHPHRLYLYVQADRGVSASPSTVGPHWVLGIKLMCVHVPYAVQLHICRRSAEWVRRRAQLGLTGYGMPWDETLSEDGWTVGASGDQTFMSPSSACMLACA